MKIYTYLLFILTVFCCCKDEEDQKKSSECIPMEAIISKDSTFEIYSPGKMEYGYANAIKLNKAWNASCTGFLYKDTFHLVFQTYYMNPNNPDYLFETEYMEVKVGNIYEKCIKLSKGVSNKECRAIFLAVNDDAVEDVYSILESDPNNYIQFDTLSLETGRVAGKFMVSFERDTSRVKKPWNPDYVRFFNGEFHCRIKN